MTTHLLDANVLIALTVREHEHHDRASTWVASAVRFALCPVVEGALVRFLVRVGESPRTCLEVLRVLHGNAACELWPDSLSYADADLNRVQGHRQVTDAYLLSLAAAHGGVVATLDEALATDSGGRAVLLPV